MRRTDDAVKSVLLAQQSEAQCLIGDREALSDSRKVIPIQAGQDGDADDQGAFDAEPLRLPRRGLGGSAQHDRAARSVDIQHVG